MGSRPRFRKGCSRLKDRSLFARRDVLFALIKGIWMDCSPSRHDFLLELKEESV